MAKSIGFKYREKPKKKRKGIHSKNTSRKQRKKVYKGQGR